MPDDFEYAITLTGVPNYGKVKFLFGLKSVEYRHQEGRTFVIDVKEVKTRIQYLSLKRFLLDRGLI